jgi:hypothetical protein
MTVKEFVKQYYPNACCERHLNGRIKGLQQAYYLIRPKTTRGQTESKAWREAKEYIVKNNIKKSI